MKVTGIVRRFDDLGRIVIPKEIRKQLFGTPEKSEGMPMEIFMNNDTIVLRKYEENKADDVCEWKLDGVYLHSPHKPLVSCVTDENYRYYYCPVCGKKIKEMESD